MREIVISLSSIVLLNKSSYICGLNNGGYFDNLTDVIFISFRVGVVSRPFFVS